MPSCSARLAAHAAMGFERRDDAARLLFPKLARRARRGAAGGLRRGADARCASREHEMLGLDARLAVGEQQRALHDVLELAHVAGPRIGLSRASAAATARSGCAERAAMKRCRRARRCRRAARAAAGCAAGTRSAGSTGPRGTRRRARPARDRDCSSRARARRAASGLLAPSGSTSRSCSTRSSLACRPRSISVTSSSSSVPPFACTNLPMLRACAPVNAPFSWPNSSASSICSGIAAQLTATKGPAPRFECAWMKRASTSLPVPLSPFSSTVTSLCATRAASSSSLRLRGILGDGLGRRRHRAANRAARNVARDALLELLGLERLDEIVDGAVAHRGDGLVDRAVRRHQQHRRRRLALLQAPQQLAAVDGLHLARR